MQTQEDEKTCMTRDCPGINSLRKNQNFRLHTYSGMNIDTLHASNTYTCQFFYFIR